MQRAARQVYGYVFQVVSQRTGNGWIAYCPGVGGVYEEGETKKDSIALAYEAACAFFDAREKTGNLIHEDGPHLRILHSPPNVVELRETAPADSYVATVSC